MLAQVRPESANGKLAHLTDQLATQSYNESPLFCTAGIFAVVR